MKLVHLMQMKATVAAPVEIGPMPIGTRRIFHATGGSFEGDRLRGEVLPGGGEWFLDAGEGMGQVDVRLLLRTDGGVPIYLRYSGTMDFNETVGAREQMRLAVLGNTVYLPSQSEEGLDQATMKRIVEVMVENRDRLDPRALAAIAGKLVRKFPGFEKPLTDFG